MSRTTQSGQAHPRRAIGIRILDPKGGQMVVAVASRTPAETLITCPSVTSGAPHYDGLAPGTSVGKALAVLDAFRGGGALLGVSQIAERAGIPKSTAHRLLSVLVDHSYVDRV